MTWWRSSNPRTDVVNKSVDGDALVCWDRALESVNGDEQLLLEVVTEFLDDTPQLLATAVEAANSQDTDRLRAAAHSIKGR